MICTYFWIFTDPPSLFWCKECSRKQTERTRILMMIVSCFKIIALFAISIAGISQLVGMEIEDDVCITRPPALKIKFLLYAITITVTMIIGCLALFVFYWRRHRPDYQGICVWFKSLNFVANEDQVKSMTGVICSFDGST